MTPPGRTVAPPRQWRTVGELVAIGAQRSQLVLVNEAHHGLLRSVRTRRVGLDVLAAAHDAGIRHLAMEALHARAAKHANQTRTPPPYREGYLAQPEMRALIADALARTWTLVAYEADFDQKPPAVAPRSDEETNWREREQARHLADALATLPAGAGMVVWCGNHHLAKHATSDWQPMATHLPELSGVDAFSIDQTPSIRFPGDRVPVGEPWVSTYTAELTSRGGSAGFLADDAPPDWPRRDLAEAFVLSVDNAMT